ncbi:MAG TPA: EAL domain-containing protein [Rhodocyclaceae bacterium]|nr:EAL domain-containing protein [Rhodocyclaceae bacterium]
MNRRSIRDVVVIYVVVATLWIVVSDSVLHRLFGAYAEPYAVDLVKEILFVAVTAWVLCVGLQRMERRQADRDHENDQQRRLAQMVFRSTSEGITVTDTAGTIVEVNPAFEAITGYTRDEVLGRNPRMLQSGRQDREFYAGMWQALLKAGQWRGEVWNRRKSGEIYPEWLTISAVRNGTGKISHYVGVFSDVSSVKEAQAQIEFLAHHDALTRLPNRALLLERLQHGLTHARRHGQRLAVMLLDLDRFKNVNDSLGHPVGDELLQEIGRRISAQIRADDTLARLGGDEFVLLLEDEASIAGIEAVARKLLGVLAKPVVVGKHALTITASIGISVYPEDGDDADTLLRNADGAMYEAKKQGRNGYAFFAPELAAGALERLVMESALRTAVARNELVLHYQPQVDLESGRLVGVEALVRWPHPELGLVSPGQFVPLAEEIGLIADIGLWVLDEACAQMVRWRSQGVDVPRVAINLSAQQLRNDALVEAVAGALQRHALRAEQLELELTESMIMEHPEYAKRVLEGLRRLGVQVAVDDFGTGYSSLAYLKLLELDRLKIDQSFVRDIGTDPNDEAITRAVIALANSLGLETVAEGVEHLSQVEFLRAEGCDAAQGYHFGRPLPADELTACLRAPAEAPTARGASDAA